MTDLEIRQLVTKCAAISGKRALTLDEIREIAAVDLASECWTPIKQGRWLRMMQSALRAALKELDEKQKRFEF